MMLKLLVFSILKMNQIFNKDNLTDLVNDVAGRYIDELETIEKDISKTNLL